MTIGIISDVHGNAEALRAVLNDMPPVDDIVSLGDVIGYGPSPSETVELVRDHCVTSLYGNHESYLQNPDQCSANSGAYHGILHAVDQLADEQTKWCTSRPYQDDHGPLHLAHGYPDDSNPFAYIRPKNVSELVPVLRDASYNVLAVGHSHIQFKQDLSQFDGGTGLVFNPGSVGQPRDGDPRAAYATFDPDTTTVTLHRVEYDVETVIEKIADADLPSVNGERLHNGKYPTSKAVTTALTRLVRGREG